VRVGRPDQLGDVRWAAPEMVGQPQPRRQPDCARQTKAVHDAESEPGASRPSVSTNLSI
jgi:hypothetical protein